MFSKCPFHISLPFPFAKKSKSSQNPSKIEDEHDCIKAKTVEGGQILCNNNSSKNITITTIMMIALKQKLLKVGKYFAITIKTMIIIVRNQKLFKVGKYFAKQIQ